MKLIPHLLILIVVLASCKPKEPSADAKAAFNGSIPKPVSIEPGNEALIVTGGPIEYTEGATKSGDKVFFSLITDPQLGDEGYQIEITNQLLSQPTSPQVYSTVLKLSISSELRPQKAPSSLQARSATIQHSAGVVLCST
jgi:hypothetical protein